MIEPIQSYADGHLVSGHFLFRSETEMEVAMDVPFPGWTLTGQIIPMNGGKVESGWTGQKGVYVAQRALEHLYQVAKHIQESRTQLIEAYQAYMSRIMELYCSTDALGDQFFLLAVENLSQDLDKDRLTYSEFEQKVIELRAMHSRYHEKRYSMEHQFFGENFPFEVDQSVRAQVLVWLRRESAVS